MGITFEAFGTLLLIVLLGVLLSSLLNRKDRLEQNELFLVLWFVAICTVLLILFFSTYNLTHPRYIFLLVLIGLILLPTIKSILIGNALIEFRSYQLIDETKASAELGKYGFINTAKNLKSNYTKAAKEINTAVNLINQGRYETAEPYLVHAVIIDEKYWYSHLLLGFIYLTLENSTIFGKNKAQMLDLSIHHSKKAIQLDPNPFNQYMNLGIAQGHMGGELLLSLAIDNLENAADMITKDKKVNRNPYYVIQRGKCITFMGEFAEKISDLKSAKDYRAEAKIIFENCPDPVPEERDKWLLDTNNAIDNLKKT